MGSTQYKATLFLITKKPLNPFLPLMGGLVILAWITLWVWEQSPYGRYLNHQELAEMEIGLLSQASLYVVGWCLMLTAMMLPTTLPLVEMFRRLTINRRGHNLLVALLICGYLTIWLVFGLVAHIFDWGLHELVEAVPILLNNSWIIGAAVLILAGAFQFSSLKYRCLDKCRAPLSFLSQHWRGSSQSFRAFLLGAHHGLFCIGCCWALMLLMFSVGTGNVGWMMGLGAIMAVEKNVTWGRRLSAPLGIGLTVWGFSIIGLNTGVFNMFGAIAG